MLQSFLTKIHGWYVAFSYAVASGILLTGFCSASYDERSPNIATLTDVKYHQRFGHFRGSRDWLDRCSDEEYASYHGHFRDESYEATCIMQERDISYFGSCEKQSCQINFNDTGVANSMLTPLCIGIKTRSKNKPVTGLRSRRLFTHILQGYLSLGLSGFDQYCQVDMPDMIQILEELFSRYKLAPDDEFVITYEDGYSGECFKVQQDSGEYIWVYSAK